jgi:hypothetical protein
MKEDRELEMLEDSMAAFSILVAAHIEVSNSFSYWNFWKEFLLPGWLFKKYEGKNRYTFAWDKLESAQKHIIGIAIEPQ